MNAARAKGSLASEVVGELRRCWRQLPDKGMFFALLAAWLALFHFLGNSTFGYIPTASVFHWMFNAYVSSPTVVGERPSPLESPFLWLQRVSEGMSSSDDGHGLLVPFVVLVLFYLKRDELLRAVTGIWLPALFIIAAALALHMVGYMIQQTRVSIVAMFIGVYGLMGLVWGKGLMRASFFPFVLFAFCIPLGSLAGPISFPLRLVVSQIVTVLSRSLLGIDVIREGTRIFTPDRTFEYEIAPACSGIRSLVAILAVSTIYAFLGFRSGWRRALIIASTVPLAVVSNVFRMMTIVFAAEAFGQEWGNYVHYGGPFGILSLLPYVPAILGLMLLGHLLKESMPASEKPKQGADQ
ncbi:MAG: exosortase/archaeosortase family protein [Verrucomicrobiae bacterium]|nr:exosortase/archaeosortase family protein [Verrucomicrobiae bacterium]